MARFLYWLTLAIPFVAYLGYPLGTIAAARLRGRAEPHLTDPAPSVTVCIAAHDEEAAIERVVRSCLAQAYDGPPQRVLVGLDGCQDGTRAVMERLVAELPARVGFLDLPRRGKAATDNALVAAADTAVVATTAAGAEWMPGTLQALAEPFRDPRVGCTTGRFVPRTDGSGAAEGESLYWRLEHGMMAAEGDLGILAMASGTCMAHRRAVFEPIPEESDGDVTIAPHAALLGYRVLFAREARVRDDAPDRLATVLRNRRRMALRAIPATIVMIGRLLRARRMGPALALVAHKVLRWITPFAVLGWIPSAIIVGARPPYGALSLAYAGLGLVGAAGGLLGGRRLRGTMQSFGLAQVAFALACLDVVRGRRARMWTRG